jgi:hypothetical protein
MIGAYVLTVSCFIGLLVLVGVAAHYEHKWRAEEITNRWKGEL